MFDTQLSMLNTNNNLFKQGRLVIQFQTLLMRYIAASKENYPIESVLKRL